MNTQLEKIWLEMDSHLFNFINKRIKNNEDSRDILHDVFLKVHSNINSLKDENKISSWIFQITRNTINDHFRKNNKMITTDQDIEVVEEESSLETQKLSQCINEMIDSLPEKYKLAVYETEINGLSQIELSEKLNISYSGAKSRVQRGREKLKELVQDCCEVSADKYGNIIEFHKRSECLDDCRTNEISPAIQSISIPTS